MTKQQNHSIPADLAARLAYSFTRSEIELIARGFVYVWARPDHVSMNNIIDAWAMDAGIEISETASRLPVSGGTVIRSKANMIAQKRGGTTPIHLDSQTSCVVDAIGELWDTEINNLHRRVMDLEQRSREDVK